MSLSLSGDGTVTGVTAIGDVSSTELGYLDGVTSALQTQINTKADASTQGLVLIDEESFSAVSSVSLNNVFSATYQNYKIIFTMSSQSSAVNVRLRLRASGSDNTSSNYYYNGAELASDTTTSVLATRSNGTQTGFVLGPLGSTTGAADATIYNPFLSQETMFNSSTVSQYDSNVLVRFMGGRMTVTTSYDGFTLYPDSGTFTGTVRVYGYKGA